MTKEKNINFAMETVENLIWNGEFFDDLFFFMEKIISENLEITLTRIGNKEPNAVIRDLNHLTNFKKRFDFPRNK